MCNDLAILKEKALRALPIEAYLALDKGEGENDPASVYDQGDASPSPQKTSSPDHRIVMRAGWPDSSRHDTKPMCQ